MSKTQTTKKEYFARCMGCLETVTFPDKGSDQKPYICPKCHRVVFYPEDISDRPTEDTSGLFREDEEEVEGEEDKELEARDETLKHAGYIPDNLHEEGDSTYQGYHEHKEESDRMSTDLQRYRIRMAVEELRKHVRQIEENTLLGFHVETWRPSIMKDSLDTIEANL